MGYLDRNNCTDSSRTDLADIRRDYPGGNDSGCFLSLCTGTGNTYSYYGSYRKCNETWFSGKGR